MPSTTLCCCPSLPSRLAARVGFRLFPKSPQDGADLFLSLSLSLLVSQIRDFELCLADTQPAAVGGAMEEFVFSPRLDNLQSSFCALKALLGSCANGSLEKDPNIRMIALFDHEEVGSESSHGAGSLMLESTLRRLSASATNQNSFEQAVAKSFIVSADQAHGTHPNYADKHEGRHRPELNQGVVIKYNSNQRYATNASTAFVIKEIARRRNIPTQEVMVKNDSPCGSTIGPILSSGLGIRTVGESCLLSFLLFFAFHFKTT